MKEYTDSIPDLLEKYPRANLLPTPAVIHKLPRLSSTIGYSIYILREDLTGFALGGNKTRKLDYLVGDAVAKRADTLVTMKATSFSRNAAAAGRVCGLDVHVVMLGGKTEQNPLSEAFFKQYSAKLYYVPESNESALADAYNNVVNSLKAHGKAVYELHPGGSDSIGALGYVDAFHQILNYSRCSGIHFSNIIHSTSSVGTQAGLVLGQCMSGYDTRIIGVSASQPADVQSQRVQELALSTAQILGIQMDEEKILVDDKFIGSGYAIPSKEGKDAVTVFASLEGILLDQVYTGKAAAGLIYFARSKMFKGDNVLFIHTGGNSGLYY
jgi:1-aminocyclopropane-1-carboxylate deaminase/D-cysteine desulfhydrase-like pyridoxal-dependent ACC family enzyme